MRLVFGIRRLLLSPSSESRVNARSPKRVAAAPSEQEADPVDRTFA
jgi:hypothetical protein